MAAVATSPDSHTLTMEKVKVHQLFDCMSYGVAKIKKS